MDSTHPQGPLRICMVVGYDISEEGGVKRHAMHLADALRRRGDSVAVIGPSSDPAQEAGSELRSFGGVINIRANGSDNRMGLFTPVRRLRAFLREQDFDVVHVHEPLLPALGYWAQWLTPRAAHLCTFHSFSEREAPGMQLVRSIAGSLILGGYQRGIAVSEPAARFARAGWRRPLVVIPNGVPTGFYTPPEEPRSPGPFRILFVGSWRDARKGLPFLLRAFAQLRTRGIEATLDVVGKGDPAQLPELPSGVTLHGVLPQEAQLAEQYRRCDLFVSPATGQESFGIVLLEAMSCGRPVVCSDIAGFRQVIDETGARFVPPRDVDELTRAIESLIADPEQRRRMALANRRRALDFGWESIADRVRGEYLEALKQRGRGTDTLQHHRAA